ncbi:MAG TPA: hypothetical protein VMC85_08595 [Desulfomonilaceae bacterium]|nr:hypothetical protein [Desulfomonilaceae bacterium]
MSTPNREIKAKPFVKDRQDGMGDRHFVVNYVLCTDQVQVILRKLLYAGTIDEMEVCRI